MRERGEEGEFPPRDIFFENCLFSLFFRSGPSKQIGHFREQQSFFFFFLSFSLSPTEEKL